MRQDTNRLPLETTSFVGRREAAAGVKEALAGARLVTLTGAAGVGKSRLAAHVAAELRRAFADGVRTVQLGNLRDPGLLPQSVAVALEIHDHSLRDPATVVAGYLADKTVLLVLDDCEHLLQACSELVDGLLAAAPRVRILATSLEPLRNGAECIWPVPPLSLPTPDDPESGEWCEALALFAERGAEARPGFTINPGNVAAVTRLCRRLDGLPLAIELAAVRLRELSPEEILARLDDRFRLLTEAGPGASARHETLRAAVDWSFELCSEAERTMWVRCSVFAGDFDLAAAEYVCSGLGLSEQDVFTAVSGLIDKSVLSRVEDGTVARYRMLETVREYALERLAADGTADTFRRRHRDYYLRVAERSGLDSTGPRQRRLVEEMRAQRENLLAAFGYCLDTPGEGRTCLRMATSLWFTWICGFVTSGRSWLERALAACHQPCPEVTRALWLEGWIAFLQRDPATSRKLWHECREIAEAIGDQEAIRYVDHLSGWERMWVGDLEEATRLLDSALQAHRAAGRWTALGLTIYSFRAQAAVLAGDLDLVLSLLDECRSRCEPIGESWALSWVEWTAGLGSLLLGRPGDAETYLRTALRAKEELHDNRGVACCVDVLAWAAVAGGDARRGAVLFGAVAELWKPLGGRLFGTDKLLDWGEERRTAARAQLGGADFERAVREGRSLNSSEVVAYALGAVDEVLPTQRKEVLTKRERDVAVLVADVLSNKEIASRLVISPRTVETHLDHILTKLGFTSRTQIAVWLAGRDED